MAEIKSYHPGTKQDRDNFIERFRNTINSLDSFTKSFLVVILIIIAITPLIIASRFIFAPHAATSGSVTFVDSSGNPISQTSSTTVNIQLYAPWPIARAETPPSTHMITRVEGASAYTLYDDALENGWKNGSYKAAVNFGNANPVYAGTKSINAKLNSGHGALEFNAPSNFSTNPYTHVQFSIQATASNEDLVLYVENANFSSLGSHLRLYNYGGYPSTTGWTVYTVPISDLGAVNKILGDVSIQNNTGGSLPTIYVDQVQFVNLSTTTPTPTLSLSSTLTPTPTLIPNTPTPVPSTSPTPTVVQSSSYYTTVTADNPIAYWRLGETSGVDAINAVGASYPGTYNSSPSLGQSGAITGDTNSSAGFNGSSSYVSVPYSSPLNPSGAFSVELWAYPNSTSTAYRGVASSRNYPYGWVLYQTPSNTWEFWINSGSGMTTVSGGNAMVNGWSHLVMTFDGTTARFYVNGIQISTGTSTSYTPNTSSIFTVGQGAIGNNYFFNGKVDEVSFYSKVLTATQVTSHYNAGISGIVSFPTPTPSSVHIASAVLSESSDFSTNPLSISPFNTNPYTTTYTFSDSTVGTKTFYVKFVASDGSTQVVSSTINLVSPAIATPTPTSSLAATPTPISSGNTWYVSKTGSNADGKTYATAWSELSKIVWSSVQPGDRIVMDGGSTSCNGPYNGSNAAPYDFTFKPTNCGMVYNTTLTINKSGTQSAPITIQLSQDSGHNGTVVMFGGRTASLPYCNQSSYTNQTSGVVKTGIVLGSNQYVTIDGLKRSGIIIYGFNQGIITATTGTANMTLRNMEVFDNGVATFGTATSAFGSPVAGSPTGWWSDGWAVFLYGGNTVTFDRMLLHDNGQDVFQGNAPSGDTNIAITNSWLYNSRENPLYPGYEFNSGPNEVCTHVDALETAEGSPVNNGLTIQNDIIGPYLNQGLYTTNLSTPQWNNVTVNNDLFMNVIADAINTVTSAPTGYVMSNLTFYRYGINPDGSWCCTIDGDIWPAGDTITNSISYGGDINGGSGGNPKLTGSNNIYYNSNGTTLAGGTNTNPLFTSPLTTGTPTFAQIMAVDLTPTCSTCSGKGSTLHKAQDILNLIDSLNITNP